MDRLTGLVVLAVLTVVFSTFFIPPAYWILAAALVLVMIGIFFLVTQKWISQLVKQIWKLLFYSMFVQITQIGVICLLLHAIGAAIQVNKHSFLFLLSSVASTFPISVGGVGIREVVFLKGSEFLGLNAYAAVTATILFDVIVTLTAASGSLPILFKKEV